MPCITKLVRFVPNLVVSFDHRISSGKTISKLCQYKIEKSAQNKQHTIYKEIKLLNKNNIVCI